MSDVATSLAPGRAAISRPAQLVLVVIRIAIGWHFLYEGVVKVMDPRWTAADYLSGSIGPFAAYFHALAEHGLLLKIVDQVNMWALVVIGACLMLGVLTRLAAAGGVLLLALYYLAYPPFFGPAMEGMAEGHYLLVNKNLVELLALCAIMVMPVRQLGLDGLRDYWRARRPRPTEASASPCAPGADAGDAWNLPNTDPYGLSRRHALARLVGVPVMGGFVLAFLQKHGWHSYEEKQLAGRADARTGATLKKFDFSTKLDQLHGRLPFGQIGNLKLSRMLLGGNLIGGWAHARDLIYVSKLIRAYHHREKVFETLRLAEACGVNTINTNPQLCGILNDYWKTGGKIQFVSDCGGEDVIELAKVSIGNGASACYLQGARADVLVKDGRMDVFHKFLELVRKAGMPAGIGAHCFGTIEACAKEGLTPDFWVKTLHHHKYWSSRGKEEYDNLWCDYPEKTIEFMKGRKEPWIAFKILAAGAIEPADGFKYAFTHGADFICVGMYDFQMVEDVNIVHDLLAGKVERERAWYA